MSRLACLGLAAVPAAVADCVAQAEGLETIRIVFPDLHGLLRGKTIMIDRLQSVLENGLGAPATLLLKDTSGRTAFPVWDDCGAPSQGVGDLLMVPDLTSLRRETGSDGNALLFCDVYRPDGTAISFAPRAILHDAVRALTDRGLTLTVGLELEFHVLPAVPNAPALTTEMQLLSDDAGQANRHLLHLIRERAEAQALPLASLEVEHGAGQFEATFAPGSPCDQAEIACLFRQAVKTAATDMHLRATFMCKPPAPATAASGWHIHQSLSDGATNLHQTDDVRAAHWIAGLLTHAPGACLLTNPTVNAYRRFVPASMAPDRIAWGHDTRGAMIRAITDGPASRIENRAPEPAANPWLAIAAQIISGIAGLDAGRDPPPPVTTPYATDATPLPRSLGEAIIAFRTDPLWSDTLGAETVHILATVADSAWTRYLATTDTWDRDEYLDLF